MLDGERMKEDNVVQRFKIDTPEELRELKRFSVSGTASSIERVASVWHHGKQRNGKTPWDDSMMIVFSTDDRQRKVYITRSSADKHVDFGDFQYNKALQWCRNNLRPVNP